MKHHFEEQVIAIAGMAMAAKLVEEIAKNGFCANPEMETLMHALMETDPPTTEAVFIDKTRLRKGYETMINILQQESTQPGDALRYILGMVHLERKLAGHAEMLQVVGSRITQCKRQSQDFSLTHDNVIANAADIYSDTISKFRFRIQVSGQPQYLQQSANVNRIRALLLAGIRCAVLWRQTGGTRLKVILHRKKIIDTATRLLKSC